MGEKHPFSLFIICLLRHTLDINPQVYNLLIAHFLGCVLGHISVFARCCQHTIAANFIDGMRMPLLHFEV